MCHCIDQMVKNLLFCYLFTAFQNMSWIWSADTVMLDQLYEGYFKSESYCEFGSCFSHQTGQDLFLAHLLHNLGIVCHHHRHLLHHHAEISNHRHTPTHTKSLPVTDMEENSPGLLVTDVTWIQKHQSVLFVGVISPACEHKQEQKNITGPKSELSRHRHCLLLQSKGEEQRDRPQQVRCSCTHSHCHITSM